MNIDQFIEEINDCFGPPFIEAGIVEAKRDSRGEGLCLRIGNRDIQFDESFKVVGRGTSVTDPRVVLNA